MTNWGAAQAKAKFSEVLDKAEEQGPQRITRRKRTYVLLTQEAYDAAAQKPSRVPKLKPSDTLAEFFRHSPLAELDLPLERVALMPRAVKF